ncbi:MAG: plastocyanin/azurin family copper-binding protein [Nitrosopumilus sp.]|nr:cupredoxin domain-containing protein [Nitrososphaerota archaeon]
MLKQITVIGVIGVVILVIIALSFSNSIEENVEETDFIIKGDVIMPTKVSRPGCDENDRCYIPSLIVIEKGKQVTWINEDSAFHTITSGFYDAPTDLFDSGHLDPFESYTLTFDEKGTYDYFCTLHPWMKGQVIVE